MLDAFALAHYFQRQDFPTLCALMSDDAPEYKLLSPLHALCWIHDGRDYKKLVPQLDINRRQTDALMNQYWKFYSIPARNVKMIYYCNKKSCTKI